MVGTSEAAGRGGMPLFLSIAQALCLAGCVGLIAGRASAQTVDAENRETISGTVINAVTGAPVPRALVHASDESLATLTDSAGHFEFHLPKPSADGDTASTGQGSGASFSPQFTPMLVRGSAGTQLWLTARKPGFVDNASARISPQSSSEDEVTIALTPEALITGRVSLSTGEAGLGVSVQLLTQQVRDGVPRWVPHGQERTNSSGEFRFPDLHAGSYKLVTGELLDNDPVVAVPGGQAFGFPPVYYAGAPDFASSETIELTAGQNFQANLSLTHQPYYPVSIPLADEELEGGVNVNVYLQGKRGPGYSLGYNPSTHAIEGLLPNGNYVVEAFAFGPTSSGAGTENLRVAGTAAQGAPLPFVHHASVTLAVKEEFSNTNRNETRSWSDGKHNYTLRGPRSYLFAALEPMDDFEMERGTALRPPVAPNDEAIVLENVLPGRYWLRLTTQRGYVAEASAGGVDVLHEPLVVDAGANIQVEVQMRDDLAELEGTVTGISHPDAALGVPASPGWLYCIPMPESAGQFQQVAISSDGTFGTLSVAPGNYRLLAFSTQQQQIPYRDAEAMKAYDGKGPIVHIDGSQKVSAQVPLNVGP